MNSSYLLEARDVRNRAYPGVDEVALALVADAWSRTYRSRVVMLAPALDPLQTQSGIRLIPDEVSGARSSRPLLPPIAGRKPAHALDEALRAIEARYGAPTAEVVTMQLEYPRGEAPVELSARSVPSQGTRESSAYSR